MTVLFLSDWYPNPEEPNNGIFMQRYAAAVAAEHQTGVVFVRGRKASTTSKIYETEIIRDKGFPEIYVWFQKSSFKPINALRYFRALELGYSTFKDQLGKPDVIHANILPRGGFQGYWLHRRYQIPYIVGEHWGGFINDDYQQQSWLRRKLIKLAASRAAGIQVVSNALASGMKKIMPDAKYYVVPNIIPEVTQAAYAYPQKGFHWVTIGVWEHWKNCEGIIKSMPEVLAQYPDTHLHIIGDHEDAIRLSALAAEMGLLDRHIWFYGNISNEEVLSMLAGANAYVCNSYFETFGVAVAEAMAAGIPVVSTICGGPEDFVTPETGLLVPQQDPEALVNAMTGIMKTHQQYKVDALKAHAAGQFGSTIVAAQLSAIYRKVVGD